ncbi:MAG: AraC family transcriptional regulator [Candidatus Omnitrophica bacterium]|nr:AraC family transcriptional regulator [Candidatus Omnitrophota bacterium]MCM8802040.1 AraC family transcriptional regulator [Candidatus Omnitrophota bacterium]
MLNLETNIEIKFIHLSFERGIELPHFHEENQLLFFLSGEGVEYIENQKYRITPGTFVLIPKKIVHFFKSYSKKPSEILSIRFDVSQKSENNEVKVFFKKTNFYKGTRENIEAVKRLIPSIIDGKPDLGLFFKIFNMFFESSEIKKSSKKMGYIKKIEDYIEKNIGNRIKIEEIGKQLGLSVSYIRKIIKEAFGVSFIKYVNIKKIEYASKLLIETKIPISNMAGLCGFYDFNYFSRVFKKIKGVSPREFRKSHY